MGLGDWLTSRLRLAVPLAILTTGNYLGWLGWDQRYDVDAAGVVTGPYEPWQVIGLVVGLAAVAAFAGARRQPEVAVAVIPGVMTLCFSVDAAMQNDIANLVAAIAWRHQHSRDSADC